MWDGPRTACKHAQFTVHSDSLMWEDVRLVMDTYSSRLLLGHLLYPWLQNNPARHC